MVMALNAYENDVALNAETEKDGGFERLCKWRLRMPMQMMALNAYGNDGSERLWKWWLRTYGNDGSERLWKWWLWTPMENDGSDLWKWWLWMLMQNGGSECLCKMVMTLNTYGNDGYERLWKWWLWMSKLKRDGGSKCQTEKNDSERRNRE